MNELMKATRQHIIDNPAEFDMQQWGKVLKPVCSTIGCIAGTALHLHKMHHPKLSVFNQPTYNDIIDAATITLELPCVVAMHLFMPGRWTISLCNNKFTSDHAGLWEGNYRCDLDTIEQMKEWTSKWTFGFETSNVAANHAIAAIDGLESHPHYVNWQEAFENA